METLTRKARGHFHASDSIFDQPGLSVRAKLAYLYLCRCSDAEEESFPSYEQIAEACAFRRTSAAKTAIKDLINAGLLIKEPRRIDHGQTDNDYIICDPPVIQKPDKPSRETATKNSKEEGAIGMKIMRATQRHLSGGQVNPLGRGLLN